MRVGRVETPTPETGSGGRYHRYPWNQLRLGDSFLISTPKDRESKEKVMAKAEFAGYMWAQDNGAKCRFVGRLTRGGVEMFCVLPQEDRQIRVTKQAKDTKKTTLKERQERAAEKLRELWANPKWAEKQKAKLRQSYASRHPGWSPKAAQKASKPQTESRPAWLAKQLADIRKTLDALEKGKPAESRPKKAMSKLQKLWADPVWAENQRKKLKAAWAKRKAPDQAEAPQAPAQAPGPEAQAAQ